MSSDEGKLPAQSKLDSLLEYYQYGRFDDAEKLAESIIEKFPNNQFSWKILGAILKQKGRISEAINANKKAVELLPQDAEAHSNLGVTFRDLGRLDESEVSHSQAIALNPNLSEAHANLGNTLQDLGRLDEAEASYRQAIALKPNLAITHNNLGKVLKELNRTEEAETSYRQAIALNPNLAEVHNNLGNILQKLSELKDSEISYRQAILLKPDYVDAYYNLGNTLRMLGRLKEAEASQRQAIAIKSDYAEAHTNLGVILQELGKLEEAEASHRQAIAMKPDYAEAHNNLGITLKELGRLDEAEASYTQAIALKPDFAEAHNNVGNTLKELGRLDEAEASYTQAIALKPDFTSALMNRWQLLFDQKEFEAALKDVDSCNTEKSRACSLETLYELGRIDEIYKRIEAQSESDDQNLRIAAFSSFISEREKKDTAHKFCRNPISFVHFANLSSHLEDPNKFAREVIEELSNKKTIWEPYQKATFKGFQTPIKTNLFANPSAKIKDLKLIIIEELESYYLKFQNNSCSYIQKWPSRKNIWGWQVILKQQGYQKPHIHSGGWLSGVIYLKVVPSLGKYEGAIEFSLNSENYSDLNSPKLTHQPEIGDIVFFPSSLHHRTIPFTTDEDRIIISFDLIPQEFS